MFTKQRQPHCNQRLAPISKVHGIFPPQLKTQHTHHLGITTNDSVCKLALQLGEAQFHCIAPNPSLPRVGFEPTPVSFFGQETYVLMTYMLSGCRGKE